MSIVLLVMTDGRADCIQQTLASFDQMVTGPVTRRVIHDDSGDPDYRSWLGQQFPGLGIIGGTRAGFGGAIHRAWQAVAHCPERFVFHLEDDFTFDRPVDLDAMADVLEHTHVAQMALRRQPWNDKERTAGGVVEQHPDAYADVSLNGFSWLEHRLFFTTNPSLYRRELCKRGWPLVPDSEGVLTHQLLTDPDLRFAYWGARSDGPWVNHIGAERNGTGY